MKSVKAKLAETNPDRVEAFEKGAQTYAKKIVANFKDFEFVSFVYSGLFGGANGRGKYTGETMNADGMVALLNYRVSF